MSNMCWGDVGSSVAEAERQHKRREWLRKEVERPAQDRRWHTMVQELAERGITLASLIEFYKGLGHRYMLHYKAGVHKTSDVVRQAIVPLSRATGLAYASTMANGARLKPCRMVTHNWENLFRDLLAAIIAEALDLNEYGMVADMLEADISRIEALLVKSGNVHRTYWVCAFGVAQHSCICHMNSNGHLDPVSGAPHPTCDCSTEKFFNETAPIDALGRSIHCELNKFDDMVALLSAGDLDFEQVIVVDEQFDLFTRAWCIAEIAEASRIGVRQHLQIKSSRLLDHFEKELRLLRVEDMQASRPEDVEAILSKIPDKTAFNTDMQELIFNKSTGLLVRWRGMDSVQLLRRAGILAGLHHALAQSSFEPKGSPKCLPKCLC